MLKIASFNSDQVELILLLDESNNTYYINKLDKTKSDPQWQLCKSNNDDIHSIFGYIATIAISLGIDNSKLALLAIEQQNKQ